MSQNYNKPRHEKHTLDMFQTLPLDIKIAKSKLRIQEACEHFNGDIVVSFSGGKDSTVLLHLVRTLYPNIKAVFSDTGLEYPEIRDFVRTKENVDWVKPNKSFTSVIREEGLPFGSKKTARMLRDLQNPTDKNEATRTLYLTGIKRDGTASKSFKLAKRFAPLVNSKWKFSEKCCDYLKKEPLKSYAKTHKVKYFVGTMAEESTQRRVSWLQQGCNVFTGRDQKSAPLSFWTEQDILLYLKSNGLEIAKCYGEIVDKDGKLLTTGVARTGCMFCMFGVHLEHSPNRFQQMQVTHPKQWDYCINKLEFGELLDFLGIPYTNDEEDKRNE